MTARYLTDANINSLVRYKSRGGRLTVTLLVADVTLANVTQLVHITRWLSSDNVNQWAPVDNESLSGFVAESTCLLRTSWLRCAVDGVQVSSQAGGHILLA